MSNSTVLIWNNNMVTVGHSYTGHCAMNLGGYWRTNTNCYVSFWPEEQAGLLSGRQKGELTPSIIDDLRTEGYAPDHIIRLTSIDSMTLFANWKVISDQFKQYSMTRQNCSNAVASVLKASSSAGGFLVRNNAIWTPLKVKRLALAMGGTKMTWTALLAEMQANGAITAGEARLYADLGKRDARHGKGSATGTAFFSGGRRVLPGFVGSAGGSDRLVNGGHAMGATGFARHLHVTTGGNIMCGMAAMNQANEFISTLEKNDAYDG